jgi:N-acetylneuraminic acid mutarotase
MMIKPVRCLMMLAAWSMLATAALAQEPGQWAERAKLLAPNSEFAVAELDGRLYILGGYPADRVTVKAVQIYDIQADRWEPGPDLPQPINHGMAATVAGKIYLIGGQTEASGETYVDTVYELDTQNGTWVEKAKMPTKRSAGVALVHDGLIYVAGGRPPRGHDFAVYDPAADKWKTLPDLPTARNHIAGGVIGGHIHVVGGRLGGGFRSELTAVHEKFDPQAGTWSSAAPMLRPRSGINGVLASGCLHVWGGEYAEGVFPDHDYYDPRTNSWTKLTDIPVPVHGVTGAAFVKGLIHAPGGGTKQGGSSGSLHNQVYRPAVSCE